MKRTIKTYYVYRMAGRRLEVLTDGWKHITAVSEIELQRHLISYHVAQGLADKRGGQINSSGAFYRQRAQYETYLAMFEENQP